VASDRNNQPLTVSDRVQVVSGPFAGASGTVKQIHMALCFVHDPSREANNGGIIVVKGRDCKLVSAEGKVKKEKARAAPNTAPRRKIDDLVGKTVRVTKGDNKGLQGRVVDGGGFHNVLVELNARYQTVCVPRENVVLIEDEVRQVASVPDAEDDTHESGDTAGGAQEATAFSKGDEVKLLDTLESAKVWRVIDAKNVVIKTADGKQRTVAVSKLVYA
jgi:ribosomal protein L24